MTRKRHSLAREWAGLSRRLQLADQDDGWKAKGLCVDHPDPDLWFPERLAEVQGPPRFDEENRIRTQRAQAICRPCPVREECLRYAFTTRQTEGIWGGVTEQDRARVGYPAWQIPTAREDWVEAWRSRTFSVGNGMRTGHLHLGNGRG